MMTQHLATFKRQLQAGTRTYHFELLKGIDGTRQMVIKEILNSSSGGHSSQIVISEHHWDQFCKEIKFIRGKM